MLCLSEYLQRILLYRQKIWTCKYTGKSLCTYEEALACEDQALDKMKEVSQTYLNQLHLSLDMVTYRISHANATTGSLKDERATTEAARFAWLVLSKRAMRPHLSVAWLFAGRLFRTLNSS
jgi:hypothetical protein